MKTKLLSLVLVLGTSILAHPLLPPNPPTPPDGFYAHFCAKAPSFVVNVADYWLGLLSLTTCQ